MGVTCGSVREPGAAKIGSRAIQEKLWQMFSRKNRLPPCRLKLIFSVNALPS
jgi:hypothetical protein